MFEWLINRTKTSSKPAFWREYQTLFQHEWSRKQAIEAVPFVVFDTETTGLDPKKDRILSIGAVRIMNREIDLIDSFECLIRQERSASDEKSIPIHGILPVDRPGSSEDEAIRGFLHYIGNSILVGHHVLFDIGMINQGLGRMGLGRLKNRYLDTARLALRIENGPVRRPGQYPSLDQLCEQYSISPNDRHTAAGDAFLTALLFLKLVQQLKKRGVRNLRDLLR